MKVHFWGVRGSYPTAGSDTVRYGGNTACVEIDAGGMTIILDAGTGIIGLGKRLVQHAREQGGKVACVLLFSHLHHDHTQGFPFFTPAFIPGAQIMAYGPDFLGYGPQAAVEEIMRPPFFPIRLSDTNAEMSFEVLRETDALVIGNGTVQVVDAETIPSDMGVLVIRLLRSYAHPGGVLHYRFDYNGSSLVYATDTEGYVNGDRRLATFARGVDLLIHDGQYTDEHYLGMTPGLSVTQGFGHSTISMACQAAHSAQVKKLLLFHHAPEYSDAQLDQISLQARALFANAMVAYEGLEIQLDARREHLPPEVRVPEMAQVSRKKRNC